ncbi:MAG TPA: hypothetical protein VN612_10820 [Acidobacteriaceae bacterium]|nr:hypothetical protein [Acidobacteriaceae bacterium]
MTNICRLSVFGTLMVSFTTVALAQSLPLRADLASTSSSSSSSLESYVPSAQASPAAVSPSSNGAPFSGLGLGVKVGLSGIGFDVATPLVPSRLNLRGGATFFSYTPNITTNDNLNVTGTLKLQNSGIMLDFFPWHGSFRLSGGATVYNNTGINGSITVPGGKNFTLGNTTYYSNPANPAVGTGNFVMGGKAGGRVSFGWGNMVPKKGHFSFDTELGVQILSAPTVALAFQNACTSPAYTSCGAAAASDITAEQNKLQNDINFLRFYPILSLGISYKIH